MARIDQRQGAAALFVETDWERKPPVVVLVVVEVVAVEVVVVRHQTLQTNHCFVQVVVVVAVVVVVVAINKSCQVQFLQPLKKNNILILHQMRQTSLVVAVVAEEQLVAR